MADPTPVPSFADKMKMDAKTLWNDHKLFFIICGALILVVKFRDILTDLLVSGGKAKLDSATKQDAVLAATESKDIAQANQLEQQAQAEPAKETPVTDDWNTK